MYYESLRGSSVLHPYSGLTRGSRNKGNCAGSYSLSEVTHITQTHISLADTSHVRAPSPKEQGSTKRSPGMGTFTLIPFFKQLILPLMILILHLSYTKFFIDI